MSSFTTTKSVLLPELQLLATVLPAQATMPMLAMALCEVGGGQLRLTATDLNVALTTTATIGATEDGWRFCVPLKQLLALVRLFGDEDVIRVTEKAANSRIEVRWGKSRHLLVGGNAEQFPETDAVDISESFVVDGEAFRDALTRVLPCVAAFEHKYNMQGVQVELLDGVVEVVGTDGNRMAHVQIAVENTATIAVLIPTLAAKSIAKLDGETLTIAASESHVVVTGDNRTLTARLMAGKFPNWHMFIPADPPYTIAIPCAPLIAAIRRANVTQETRVIEGLSCADGLKLTFTADTLVVESRATKEGEGIEPVAITSNLNGESIEVGMTASYLLDALAGAGDSVTCQLTSGTIQLLFTNGQYQGVIQPRRL